MAERVATERALADFREQRLTEFVRESNRIEGIMYEPTAGEIRAHRWFLSQSEMTVGYLEAFVTEVAARPLREQPGMNVRVGSHRPPPGGPRIRSELQYLVASLDPEATASELTPYEAHVEYERLHPFMDGNGRSGRALWAWMMQRDGQDPFALPFLHRFYYQALDASRPASQDTEYRGEG